MKLTELKALKEETIYKRILEELKVKGLDKLYIKKTESIDYLDIIISTVNFLEVNKKILKKFNKEQFENIVIIIIDEILEEMEVNVSEDQIEKIVLLLKNSLLAQKVTNYLIDKFKNLYNTIIVCCGNKKLVTADVVETIDLEMIENN